MYYGSEYVSPIGKMILVSDEEKLVGAWFEGQKYFGSGIKEKWSLGSKISVLQEAEEWLDAYFSGKKPELSQLMLAPVGGDFRQEIWKILRGIPYGETITYGEIARQMARKMGRKTMSAQAVGGAVGHNPISILIPCHRVLGADGSLTGYAGGIEKKEWLLRHEGVNIF
ncbi:MAG: methylated-DNA--[protein]-cysteine S-methyltransferase [Lachnospiraceae bacterium]|nr:methylated-DNA--[protein]-cysteine S-methyltransferase [Lachnospiraceae bacterium]